MYKSVFIIDVLPQSLILAYYIVVAKLTFVKLNWTLSVMLFTPEE